MGREDGELTNGWLGLLTDEEVGKWWIIGWGKSTDAGGKGMTNNLMGGE